MEKLYNNTHALASLPSNDGNFISALNKATIEEIKKAIEQMNGTSGNKGRITACEREIRKRERFFKKADLCNKIIFLLKENNIVATVWEETKNVIKVQITDGNWKQAHTLCDFVIKEQLHPVDMSEKIIDDSNTKCYSSIHTYSFRQIEKEI